MKKKLKQIWDYCGVPNFVRQVLIVICGIAVTVAVGHIIEKNKINSHIKVTLNLVKDELTDLDEKIDVMIENVQFNQEGYKFFSYNANNIDKIPKDTLSHYWEKCSYLGFVSVNCNALEALKNTSQYEEIDNSLILEITNTYEIFSLIQDEWSNYCNGTKAMKVEVHDLEPFGLWRDISNEKKFEIMSKCNIFKNRCNHSFYTESFVFLARTYKGHLKKRIKLLDEVLKNNSFDNIKRLEGTNADVIIEN